MDRPEETPNNVKLLSQRLRMADEQISRRGVHDSAVLAAMRTVPRHLFIPPQHVDEAYQDGPLPIGHDQTISQPYIVASMTEQLELDADCRVLEIGTGSGYQTAVLAEIAREVYTVEIIPELLYSANEVLKNLGYRNIKSMLNDGSLGWPEHAPYDGIIVTSAAPKIPEALTDQLAPDGRLVIPLEIRKFHQQELYVIRKTAEGIEKKYLYDVRFVPMRGTIEK